MKTFPLICCFFILMPASVKAVPSAEDFLECKSVKASPGFSMRFFGKETTKRVEVFDDTGEVVETWNTPGGVATSGFIKTVQYTHSPEGLLTKLVISAYDPLLPPGLSFPATYRILYEPYEAPSTKTEYELSCAAPALERI